LVDALFTVRNDICTTIFLQLLGQSSLSYTHYVFTLSLCCFGFRVRIYISFYILGCPINHRKSGCSNNTPHSHYPSQLFNLLFTVTKFINSYLSCEKTHISQFIFIESL